MVADSPPLLECATPATFVNLDPQIQEKQYARQEVIARSGLLSPSSALLARTHLSMALANALSVQVAFGAVSERSRRRSAPLATTALMGPSVRMRIPARKARGPIRQETKPWVTVEQR